MNNFFAELKRRNVYKVAVAYAVVGWLLVRVTTQVLPFFEIPTWEIRLIALAIGIGFPIALVPESIINSVSELPKLKVMSRTDE